MLRPGGTLVLADFRHAADYAQTLATCGVLDLRRRGAGWRFWYGGPWTATSIVTGTAPQA